MALGSLQIGLIARIRSSSAAIERWLEGERDQLFLWLPVMIGAGIAAWFILPDSRAWAIAMLLAGGVAAAGMSGLGGGRAARAVAIAAFAFALGLGLIWWRAERAAAPVLARPVIETFDARIERIDPLPARDLIRLRLAPIRLVDDRGAAKPGALPAHIRINLGDADAPAGLSCGAVIRLGARLLPPPHPAVPGAYDYARVAWFDGIGATGRGFAPVTVLKAGQSSGGGLRDRLSAHIQASAPGGPGAIAAALATGDQGAIPIDDAEAMRRAGLAHLLSVSGLHITAVVGAVMLLVMRLLALSPWLALNIRLPLVAAGAGAAAAIGYTLLTGAEVPTVRSCVAALMVLAAVALGREAITLRLVAVGAIIVLLSWPEALIGPSFQLSFAAVTTIIALHDQPAIRAFFGPHEEGRLKRLGRELLSLLLTGIVVEAALSPIALFHFHKAGLYGSFANIVAIPLTTFVVMPLEALALLFDLAGAGAPIWWLVEKALALLLWIAHLVADAPGSIATLPTMPIGAFAVMVAGGLGLCLWRSCWRTLGIVPMMLGAIWAVSMPPPDLLVTGDGRHVAVRTASGGIAVLRDRTGDYNRAMLAENGGVDGEPLLLSDQAEARCSRDLCLVDRMIGNRRWRIVATRSFYLVPAQSLIAACADADIVISERRLPGKCTPRWLKLDRPLLSRTGGVAIDLAKGKAITVRLPGDGHPWANPPLIAVNRSTVNRSGAATPQAFPARAPGADHNAGDHKPGSPDRAGSSRLRGGNI